jgi:hypothetical protein
VQRASFAGGDGVSDLGGLSDKAAAERTDYEECLACQ